MREICSAIHQLRECCLAIWQGSSHERHINTHTHMLRSIFSKQTNNIIMPHKKPNTVYARSNCTQIVEYNRKISNYIRFEMNFNRLKKKKLALPIIVSHIVSDAVQCTVGFVNELFLNWALTIALYNLCVFGFETWLSIQPRQIPSVCVCVFHTECLAPIPIGSWTIDKRSNQSHNQTRAYGK